MFGRRPYRPSANLEPRPPPRLASKMDNRQIAQGREMRCYACESSNVVVTANGPDSISVDCMDCGSDRTVPRGWVDVTTGTISEIDNIQFTDVNDAGQSMFNPRKYLKMSDDYESMANMTDNSSEISRFRKLQKSSQDLADNEEWLMNNYEHTLHSDNPAQHDNTTFAAEEEHVLRCLGAALLMQWPRLPAMMQRELFDSAGTMGELQNTALLRGQIARFLHRHKDGGSPVEADGQAIGSDGRAVARWENEGGASDIPEGRGEIKLG